MPRVLRKSVDKYSGLRKVENDKKRGVTFTIKPEKVDQLPSPVNKEGKPIIVVPKSNLSLITSYAQLEDERDSPILDPMWMNFNDSITASNASGSTTQKEELLYASLAASQASSPPKNRTDSITVKQTEGASSPNKNSKDEIPKDLKFKGIQLNTSDIVFPEGSTESLMSTRGTGPLRVSPTAAAFSPDRPKSKQTMNRLKYLDIIQLGESQTDPLNDSDDEEVKLTPLKGRSHDVQEDISVDDSLPTDILATQRSTLGTKTSYPSPHVYEKLKESSFKVGFVNDGSMSQESLMKTVAVDLSVNNFTKKKGSMRGTKLSKSITLPALRSRGQYEGTPYSQSMVDAYFDTFEPGSLSRSMNQPSIDFASPAFLSPSERGKLRMMPPATDLYRKPYYETNSFEASQAGHEEEFISHKKIMGWKLTSRKRRKDLMHLIDLVSTRDGDDGESGNGYDEFDSVDVPMIDDDGFILVKNVQTPASRASNLRRSLSRQHPRGRHMSDSYDSDTEESLMTDNSRAVYRNREQFASVPGGMQMPAPHTMTRREAESWEKAVSRILRGSTSTVEGKARFLKTKRERELERQRKDKHTAESVSEHESSLGSAFVELGHRISSPEFMPPHRRQVQSFIKDSSLQDRGLFDLSRIPQIIKKDDFRSASSAVGNGSQSIESQYTSSGKGFWNEGSMAPTPVVPLGMETTELIVPTETPAIIARTPIDKNIIVARGKRKTKKQIAEEERQKSQELRFKELQHELDSAELLACTDRMDILRSVQKFKNDFDPLEAFRLLNFEAQLRLPSRSNYTPGMPSSTRSLRTGGMYTDRVNAEFTDETVESMARSLSPSRKTITPLSPSRKMTAQSDRDSARSRGSTRGSPKGSRRGNRRRGSRSPSPDQKPSSRPLTGDAPRPRPPRLIEAVFGITPDEYDKDRSAKSSRRSSALRFGTPGTSAGATPQREITPPAMPSVANTALVPPAVDVVVDQTNGSIHESSDELTADGPSIIDVDEVTNLLEATAAERIETTMTAETDDRSTASFSSQVPIMISNEPGTELYSVASSVEGRDSIGRVHSSKLLSSMGSSQDLHG